MDTNDINMKATKIIDRRFFSPFCIVVLAFYILIPFQSASGQKKKNKKIADVPAVQNIVMAENMMSLYRIVIPASATPQELKASKILQDYLLQISGAALPVITADKPASKYEIILGQNERLDKLGITINFNELQADGFVIKTDSLRLIIAGGN